MAVDPQRTDREQVLDDAVYRKTPFGRTGNAIPLNQDVDHVSILIHSPLQVVPLSLDGQEEFVQVPDVLQPSVPAPEISGIPWTRFPTLLPDGFVGGHHTSFGKEFLDIPEAQAEAVIEPDGMTDDLRRESVSAVAASMGCQQPSLPRTGSS